MTNVMVKSENGKKSVGVSGAEWKLNAPDAPVYIHMFVAAMRSSTNWLMDAAKIYAEAIRKYKDAKSNFEHYFPNHVSLFSRMEALGNGRLTDGSFYFPESTVNAIKRLSIPDQKRFIEHGTEFLCENGKRIHVKAAGMTYFQSRQLISPDGRIRSLAEQKTWLETQKNRSLIAKAALAKSKNSPVSVMTPFYTIRDHKLMVYGDMEFNLKELLTILQKMG